jgi:hypothetical protein
MLLGTVRLRHTPGVDRAWLRPLTGADEQLVEEASTVTALALLDRLLVPAPGGEPAPAAARLASADRDRVLAWLHGRVYGSRVASTDTCDACGQPFDLDFDLEALVRHAEEAEGRVPTDGATEHLPRVRPPTGEDELAVTALDPAHAVRALLTCCVEEDHPEVFDVEAVEAALALRAPLLAQDLELACPECGALQRVHFDVQDFFLASLAGERERLLREVHALAAGYGWSLGDILSLGRTERRRLASFVLGTDTKGWT